MDSDDENLIIPPEHLNLNLSDEALPELEAGALQGDDGDEGLGEGRGEPEKPAGANAVFNAEWENFQMSIASPVGEPEVLDLSDTSEATVFYQKNLFNAGFQMMESIRREGKLCDVTLTVGEHSLTAHRIVLAANIPYFRQVSLHCSCSQC